MCYHAIPTETTAPAVALIATLPLDEIRNAYTHDRLNWFRRPSVRLWGAAVRQLLRSRGFDGQYFGSDLNDIFVPLVEEALNLR